jgi:hypothetical protein
MFAEGPNVMLTSVPLDRKEIITCYYGNVLFKVFKINETDNSVNYIICCQ